MIAAAAALELHQRSQSAADFGAVAVGRYQTSQAVAGSVAVAAVLRQRYLAGFAVDQICIITAFGAIFLCIQAEA